MRIVLLVKNLYLYIQKNENRNRKNVHEGRANNSMNEQKKEG